MTQGFGAFGGRTTRVKVGTEGGGMKGIVHVREELNIYQREMMG